MGSGNTWLAAGQVRRLTREGQRVALTCYLRGLAAWLQRRVTTLPRKERPAYVGMFHNLGVEWGAPTGREDDSRFWEVELPGLMVGLGAEQPFGRLFDAAVIDEAQDFADLWWPAVTAALKDEDTGGLYVFSDEGQGSSRFGGPAAALLPLVLDLIEYPTARLWLPASVGARSARSRLSGRKRVVVALSRGVVCQEILLSRQPEHAQHFSVRKNRPSRDFACAMALASMSLA